MQRVLTSVRVFGFRGSQRTPADNARYRTGPCSGRYFLRVLLIKEDAFLRRHPAQEIVISLTVLDTKLTGRMWLAEQRAPLGHPVFLQYRAEDAFDVLILEDTEVLAQPCAPQRRAYLHAVQLLVLSFSPVQTGSPHLSPGAVRHRPAISSGRPFCRGSAGIQGERNCWLTRERSREKSEESDWFR